MGPDFAVALGRHVLLEALLLAAPVLAVACLVSLGLSLIQTLTGVQEQTLTAVPRLVLVTVVLALTLPWTVHRCVAFTMHLWTDLGRYAG